ncbi:MAG: hypothetical protein MN733_36885 [Nitrososphaera sp.]|nr:hypothetical protein [Nitrososphaera sp.]
MNKDEFLKSLKWRTERDKIPWFVNQFGHIRGITWDCKMCCPVTAISRGREAKAEQHAVIRLGMTPKLSVVVIAASDYPEGFLALDSQHEALLLRKEMLEILRPWIVDRLCHHRENLKEVSGP